MATEAPVLVASGVRYLSEGDERAFFGWLGRLECVQSFKGAGADLFISLSRAPTDDDLRELIALFYRYEIDLTQIAKHLTAGNAAWLRDAETYWHTRMFS